MTVSTRAADVSAYGLLKQCLRSSAVLMCCGVFCTFPAGAELAILSDGDFLKISAYRVVGERMELDLPSGGTISVSMTRVRRVLDDEISHEPPPEQAPEFSLRFVDGHPVPTVPYGELIFAVAERHGLNPDLVAEVVRAESAFNADAISHKGAQGLMQLMPATAERFGLQGAQVFDPASNLDAGGRYLRFLADRFDDELPLILAGYNAGEGTVARYKGVPPYRETRRYIAKIVSALGLASDS